MSILILVEFRMATGASSRLNFISRRPKSVHIYSKTEARVKMKGQDFCLALNCWSGEDECSYMKRLFLIWLLELEYALSPSSIIGV